MGPSGHWKQPSRPPPRGPDWVWPPPSGPVPLHPQLHAVPPPPSVICRHLIHLCFWVVSCTIPTLYSLCDPDRQSPRPFTSRATQRGHTSPDGAPTLGPGSDLPVIRCPLEAELGLEASPPDCTAAAPGNHPGQTHTCPLCTPALRPCGGDVPAPPWPERKLQEDRGALSALWTRSSHLRHGGREQGTPGFPEAPPLLFCWRSHSPSDLHRAPCRAEMKMPPVTVMGAPGVKPKLCN